MDPHILALSGASSPLWSFLCPWRVTCPRSLGTEFQSEGAGTPSPTPSEDHGTFTSMTPRPQVRERDLPFVTHTLSSEFTILRVVNGETVAAENLGITNGFVKPKLGELREGRVVQRNFRK